MVKSRCYLKYILRRITLKRSLAKFLILLAVIGWPVTSKAEGDHSPDKQIAHYLKYRSARLFPRSNSAIFDSDRDRDAYQQIYGTLRLAQVAGFMDQVVFEPAFYTERDNPNANRLRIDQAYAEVGIGDQFRLLLGKKLELNGSGFLHNPSDLLHQNRDIIDELNNREGTDLVKLRYASSFFSWSFGIAPKLASNLSEGSVFSQADLNLWGADLSLRLLQNKLIGHAYGMSISRFFGEDFSLHYEGRHQTQQNSPDVEVEREFSGVERSSASNEALIGGRYLISNRTSIFIELNIDSAGLTSEETAALYEKQRELAAEGNKPLSPFSRIIGQHYVSIGFLADQIAEDFRLKSTLVYNQLDRSYLFVGSLKYEVGSLVTLAYEPIIFGGSKNSEFGENPFKAAHYLSLTSQGI
jgi:hypothetical protein